MPTCWNWITDESDSQADPLYRATGIEADPGSGSYHFYFKHIHRKSPRLHSELPQEVIACQGRQTGKPKAQKQHAKCSNGGT